LKWPAMTRRCSPMPRGRDLPADVPVALTALASFDALLEVGA
jgi:hypothetical protein